MSSVEQLCEMEPRVQLARIDTPRVRRKLDSISEKGKF